MMSDKKRKWILGIVLFILIGGPIGLLNSYTLNRFQKDIKDRCTNGESDPSMPKRQCMIASAYRYTLRNESAADAYQQYMELFYEADRNGDKDARARAEDAIWTYPNVLEDIQKRYDEYEYLQLLLDDWPDHPRRNEAQTRLLDLKLFKVPPDDYQLRPLPRPR